VSAFGRGYDEGSEEYQMRQSLFEASAQAVQAQNGRSGSSWRATLNHLADRTEAELLQLRGRRGRWNGRSAWVAGGSSLLQQGERASMHRRNQNVSALSAPLPESVDWKQLQSLQEIPDQGACGSCWAIATAAVLSAGYEIANGNADRTFSAQELVDCTPNKDACGGTGGCDGATMELGLHYVQQHGLSEDATWPYIGKSENVGGGCPAKQGMFQSFLQQRQLGSGGGSVGMQSWSKLAENKQEPLMRAVLLGPVGISAAAADWQLYSSGVFDGCERDAVVDHAVVLTGFGQDSDGGSYWSIRNSWGPSWGENGYIRLRRFDTDEGEEGHCGVDNRPKDGTACKPYPDQVPVCGMCGILYDSVAAHFKKL